MTKNRKLATAAGSVAIVGAAVAITAGTYSYFTDTQTAPNQSVGAGTLKLSIGGDAVQTPMSASNVEPGWSSGNKTMTFTGAGTLNGKLRLTATGTGDAAMRQALQVTISGPNFSGTLPLSQLISAANGVVLPGTLNPGSTQTYTFSMSIPSDTGNSIQGKSGGFTLKADLLQTSAANNISAFPAS